MPPGDRDQVASISTSIAQSPPVPRLRKTKMAPWSPRSSNYDRLEGGMGPSRMGGRRTFGWAKFAVGAAVIIGLVYMFGPRETGDLPQWTGYGSENKNDNSGISRPPVHEDDVYAIERPAPPTQNHPPPSQNTPAKPHPTSPATDPDLSKTVFCTSPHKPGSRLVQYALMIDAGSTGSRIHVYKFNNCGPSAEFEYEVFKQTQPGLSSYKGRAIEAAESLDILLDEALKVVPESLRKCTPVAVKATAGLRLLGTSDSDAILDAVRHRLNTKYPFPLEDKEGVVIMDGKDEGVFAWITANYLLNTIKADTPPHTPAYAVLDLGGASTQIVFEPTFDKTKPDSKLEEGEHKYDLKFGGKDHVLYQHSYLGYGLMRARASVHRLVNFMSMLHPSGKAEAKVGNPCLAQGTERTVEVEDEKTGQPRNVTMAGKTIGGFDACNRIMQLVMAKDAICEVKPCSFNGVYQPNLLETFPTGKVMLLSYFYDRINPLLLKTGSKELLTVSTLASLARTVCLGKSAWTEKWGSDKNAMEELEGRPEYCLDLTFMHALLRLGYEFDDDREVVIGKQIDGTELGWALGATIAMVGGELTCRV